MDRLPRKWRKEVDLEAEGRFLEAMHLLATLDSETFLALTDKYGLRGRFERMFGGK